MSKYHQSTSRFNEPHSIGGHITTQHNLCTNITNETISCEMLALDTLLELARERARLARDRLIEEHGLPEGRVRLRVHQDTDLRDKPNTYAVPCCGNPMSFEDAHARAMAGDPETLRRARIHASERVAQTLPAPAGDA